MRRSPAMEKAYNYLSGHPDATVQDLMACGVSRATAFKAMKAYKEQSKSSEAVKKVTKTIVKKTVEVKAKPKKRGFVPMDEIPKHLRKLPRLTLEGFSLEQQSKTKPKEIVWSDRVYIGACPVCTNSVNMFKKMQDRKPFYEGPCKICGITVKIMV